MWKDFQEYDNVSNSGGKWGMRQDKGSYWKGVFITFYNMRVYFYLCGGFNSLTHSVVMR